MNGVSGEVIVADNGSTDGSIEIAAELNARVVNVPVRGYGAALAAGIQAAKGKYIIMGDSDESYDFSALTPFIDKLRQGYDLVMGNRFSGGIAPGAMPPMHRYFGNPLLTALGRLFFSCKESGDFYCGLRGFRRDAVQRLTLQSQGMEFALEMIIKAEMHGLRITEVPTTLSRDGRDRAPHLRRYRDGWRSLRFYLLMSPRWFFGIPGMVLLAGGGLISALLLIGSDNTWLRSRLTITHYSIQPRRFCSATNLFCSSSSPSSWLSKQVCIRLKPSSGSWRQRRTLERCMVAGIALIVLGIVLGIIAARQWELTGFGSLQPAATIRLVICSVLFLLLGGQTLLAGFYFGLINLVAERRAQRLSSSGEVSESEVTRNRDGGVT